MSRISVREFTGPFRLNISSSLNLPRKILIKKSFMLLLVKVIAGLRSPHHHTAHAELADDMFRGHRPPEERLDLPGFGPLVPVDDAEPDPLPPSFPPSQRL